MYSMVSKLCVYILQYLIQNRHVRGRHPLEDHDPNSQDSGFFSVPSEDSRSINRFFFIKFVINFCISTEFI